MTVIEKDLTLIDKNQALLAELGLTPYASRLLAALLVAEGPLGSAELANLTGVPRTSIYQVMHNLSGRGMVTEPPTHGASQWRATPRGVALALTAEAKLRVKLVEAGCQRLVAGAR